MASSTVADGRVLITILFSQTGMNFNSSVNEKGIFSLGAQQPSPAILVGRGLQIKFRKVQFFVTQESVNQLGGIALKLQQELAPLAVNIDWDRVNDDGYGRAIKVCVGEALTPWISRYIVNQDEEFAISFFSH